LPDLNIGITFASFNLSGKISKLIAEFTSETRIGVSITQDILIKFGEIPSSPPDFLIFVSLMMFEISVLVTCSKNADEGILLFNLVTTL